MYGELNFLYFVIPVVFAMCLVILCFLVFVRQNEISRRRKRIEFTSREIEKIIIDIKSLYELNARGAELIPDSVDTAFQIFNAYNKIAKFVMDGIYDEIYVENLVGNDMKIIYKNHMSKLRELRMVSENDGLFIELEMLLSLRGENKDYYRNTDRRGYF